MMRTLLLLLFFCPFLCQAELIKILIAQDTKEILLEAKGRFTLYQMPQALEIAAGTRSKRQLLTLSEQGLSWGDLYQGVFHLQLEPLDAKSCFLVNGIEYKGNISIYGIDDKLFVVNELDVETYLKSSLPLDIDTNLRLEVLEAVSVAMRTYAYYQIQRMHDKKWHFDAENPPFMGSILLKQKNAVLQAIDTTAHELLTYQDVPFATFFTEDCAGKTASFAQIFNQEIPSPPSIEIPRDFQSNPFTWRLIVEKSKIQKALALLDIDTIDCSLDALSGKVATLRLVDKTPVAKNIDFLALQALLGKDKLLSNDFVCTMNDTTIIFEGKGKGLGVGLCLKTAQILADHKKTYKEILQFFYPETQFFSFSKD